MKNLPAAGADLDTAFEEDSEFSILPARTESCTSHTLANGVLRHLRGTSNKYVRRTIPDEALVTTDPGLWQMDQHLKVRSGENGKTTFRSGVPASVGQCRSSWKCFQDPTRYPPQRDQAVLLGVSESGAQRQPCYCKGLKNNTEVIRYFCEPYGMLVPVLSLEPQTPCPAGGSSSAERVWRMTMEKTTVGFYCGSFGEVVDGPKAWEGCPNKP